MSDHDNDHDKLEREWLSALLDEPSRAVEELESGREPEVEGADEILEVLGLLPLTVEEQAPSPGLKERILEAAAGQRSAEPGPAGSDGSPTRETEPPARRSWLLPLAATLAIAALGFAGWQTARVDELRAVVESQAAELSSMRAEAVTMRAEAQRAADLERHNADLATAIALLTAAGVEFCPLRPPSASSSPQAWGALAMSQDGGHWYLRVSGLEPRDDGYEYRLWFLLDGEPMKGTRLEERSGDGALQMMNGAAPERFNAVLITLEPAGSEKPSGERLLFGNERMQVL